VLLVFGGGGYFLLQNGRFSLLPNQSNPEQSCGTASLVLVSHNFSGNQLFTTWHNCQSFAVKFFVAGKVWSKATDVTNNFGSVSLITVLARQSTSVVLSFSRPGAQIDQTTVYAVNATSTSNVLSPVYNLYS
jgi:hypothetical protein